jgi:DNA repair protein RecN (Recombination protein N)
VLTRLHIRNLAIVEDVSLELSGGLTVITGETGAGKSILVDALALLAGGRASSDLVRRGADRLTVSGEFELDASARAVLADAGLSDGDRVVVRRELSADGRGRAFVEDEPAAVRTLARLGERLVAIHGQSSEQELADADAPLEILDAYAHADAEREATAAAAREWAQARERRESLEASARSRTERLDLLEFQIREVEAARPQPGEDERLRTERQRLLHADRIRRAAGAALDALSEAEGSAADRLGEAARAFAELAAIDPAEDSHREEADELKRRVADLAAPPSRSTPTRTGCRLSRAASPSSSGSSASTPSRARSCWNGWRRGRRSAPSSPTWTTPWSAGAATRRRPGPPIARPRGRSPRGARPRRRG